MLDGLLIVHSTGVPIYYYISNHLQKRRKDSDIVLFSGLLTAIQAFLKEVEIGDARIFETEKNLILIHSEKEYFVALLIPLNQKNQLDSYHELITQINLLFKNWEKELEGLEPESLSSIKEKIDEDLTEVIKNWEKENNIPTAARKLKESLW